MDKTVSISKPHKNTNDAVVALEISSRNIYSVLLYFFSAAVFINAFYKTFFVIDGDVNDHLAANFGMILIFLVNIFLFAFIVFGFIFHGIFSHFQVNNVIRYSIYTYFSQPLIFGFILFLIFIASLTLDTALSVLTLLLLLIVKKVKNTLLEPANLFFDFIYTLLLFVPTYILAAGVDMALQKIPLYSAVWADTIRHMPQGSFYSDFADTNIGALMYFAFIILSGALSLYNILSDKRNSLLLEQS